MEEVLAAMQAAHVPSGPILSTADILQEEQYRSRNMFHVTKPPSGKALSLPCCGIRVHGLGF